MKTCTEYVGIDPRTRWDRETLEGVLHGWKLGVSVVLQNPICQTGVNGVGAGNGVCPFAYKWLVDRVRDLRVGMGDNFGWGVGRFFVRDVEGVGGVLAVVNEVKLIRAIQKRFRKSEISVVVAVAGRGQVC